MAAATATCRAAPERLFCGRMAFGSARVILSVVQCGEDRTILPTTYSRALFPQSRQPLRRIGSANLLAEPLNAKPRQLKHVTAGEQDALVHNPTDVFERKAELKAAAYDDKAVDMLFVKGRRAAPAKSSTRRREQSVI